MRLTALVTLVLLSTTFLAAAPVADARPSPVCLQDRSPCPDDVCVDTTNDGKFTYEDTCVGFVCPTWGCCGGPCPPPPAASVSTAATCTPYMNVGGTKQRTCVDPDAAPRCGAWTEGWSQLGYYRACYGADVDTCNPTWCLREPELPALTWSGVCTEKRVGGTPVAVTAEYGTGVGCLGLTYTTCKLSYYPGEPNTPVWSCTTKRVL